MPLSSHDVALGPTAKLGASFTGSTVIVPVAGVAGVVPSVATQVTVRGLVFGVPDTFWYRTARIAAW